MFFFYQYDRFILCEEGFSNVESQGRIHGYKLKIRLNTYRSLPLSCIEKLELKVDGNAVSPDHIVFCLDNKRFLISQLHELYTEWWDVLEKAELYIDRDRGLSSGSHTVEIWLGRRGPYMAKGPEYFCFTGHDCKELSLV